MKLFLAALGRSRLILVMVILAGYGAKEASGAQVQSLSRITTQQIRKTLELPPEITIYEPPVECYDPNSQCSGMDRAKKLWDSSDEGNLQLSECGSMRLFRFAGIKHLNLTASLCQQGPFAMPELNETKTRAQRLTDLFLKDIARLNPGKNPLSQLRDTQTVSINNETTAHIFTILLFGHGMGLAPTAVVTSPQTTATFVLQLFIVPDDNGTFMANLMPRTNEVMEALVKELYRTTG